MDELLFGSPAHRPLKADEMIGWMGYDKILAWEQQEAMKKARRKK